GRSGAFASMGPRLICRGNEQTRKANLDNVDTASMGPRLICRGNARSIARQHGRKYGFNGAATDLSRKCERLFVMARRGGKLQWGRD
ncbi:MAG: hypothetical protein ACRD4I_12725, partial [Candidatus Angelobacter sp.]